MWKALPLPMFVIGLLIGAAVAGCDASERAGQSRPIRIVRAGNPDLDGMKRFISFMWAACRAERDQRLPQKSAPLPSDEYFANFRAYEIEELFDGNRWAQYETKRMIAPDMSRDCELVVFSQRLAVIEQECKITISGNSTLLADMINNNDPSRHTIQVEDMECEGRRPDPLGDVAGLPSESAGNARCVWDSIIADRAAGLPPNGRVYDGYDFCLYDKLTQYPMGSGHHPVTLKSRRLDKNSMAGTPLPTEIPYIFETNLVSFSDGNFIPPERFTRYALESFLKQPAKEPIREAK